MNIPQYIEAITQKYKSGISSEHTYRADLENLIREQVPGVNITNEPSKVTDCGNPDYVITKNKIPLGFIEAKDVGKDLNHKQYKEQFGRYRQALDNLIITDYLWFQFFQHGELVHEIRIGEITESSIRPLPDNYDEFESLITNFCTFIGQTIKSSKKLAEMMAAKARLLQIILDKAVSSDEESEENSTLKQQYQSFKEVLIHDLEPTEFADIYAQTLAYGMFAARLHDASLEDFSRQEAAELIPKTNPFLRKLFQYIAGYDIDERIKITVDNLVEVFRATNVKALLKNLSKSTLNNDPIVHFYETFLAEYDPKLRKTRGVWYTPEPVVKFIVQAVDDLLKTEFSIKDGLADASTTTIKIKAQGTAVTKGKNKGKAVYGDKKVHKVQILDPATGTGTFLAEVVKYIYREKFGAMQGVWSSYVEEHLIPRLNGFELLMASYAIAHLKLDMLLAETGYQPKKEQRFNIFLTNSLEEHHPDTGTLFANWLSTEANEANHIKRDTPVMVVLGNPPYSVSSSNKGEWIQGLIKDYKKDLNEKKLNLDDDYIKFIRYGEYFVEKNCEGILAYISNNSFIDGVTHRQMRKHLLETFDKIYILDLHGSSKKNEIAPDGGKDENVFDIMQGVSINIFIKTNKEESKRFSTVYHANLWGTRDKKQTILLNDSLNSLNWKQLTCKEPYFFFTDRGLDGSDAYNQGIYMPDLFQNYNSGIQTKCDEMAIQFSKESLLNVINSFTSKSIDELKSTYLKNDTSGWTYENAQVAIKRGKFKIAAINFRPFDERQSIYCDYSGGFIGRPREKTMKHLLNKNNLAFLFPRQAITEKYGYFVTNKVCDINFTGTAGQYGAGLVFPLYLYPETGGQQVIGGGEERIPNLDKDILERIASGLGLAFTPEKVDVDGTFAPIDILDYIYATLHSPNYREKYKEFLKIDFPRVPYPENAEEFWELVALGSELRQIHLLESPAVERFITTYPADGDNTVSRKMTKKSIGYEAATDDSGRVWINDDQYFENVPLIAWEFFIGGYQPAQKWLKDRYGRTLSYEDIQHYQKIIVALIKTSRLMKEIDNRDLKSNT